MTGTIHATAVLVGGDGVLIRGPSGAGKTTLALALIDEGARRGLAVALVGDDRIRLESRDRGAVAHRVAGLEGQVEVYGLGVVPIDSVAEAPIRLVVDRGENAPRMPETADLWATVAGHAVPRLLIGPQAPSPASLVLRALALIRDGHWPTATPPRAPADHR